MNNIIPTVEGLNPGVISKVGWVWSSGWKKNDLGEKGAGREKTRVGSSQREKAGEIEGCMQPKNTMFNISK